MLTELCDVDHDYSHSESFTDTEIDKIYERGSW